MKQCAFIGKLYFEPWLNLSHASDNVVQLFLRILDSGSKPQLPVSHSLESMDSQYYIEYCIAKLGCSVD